MTASADIARTLDDLDAAARTLLRARPTVAVINASTAVTDAQVAQATAAVQMQVSRDFAPAWGLSAQYSAIPTGGTPPAGAWWLVIADTSDSAGALGYHDLTDAGLPTGKIFAGTDIQAGASWTVTLSHEALEQLLDPWCSLTIFIESTQGGGKLIAYEAADAPEDDQFGYDIQGVRVSDFVLPPYFMPGLPGTPRYDFQSHITQALELLPGGYASIYTVSGQGAEGWQQVTAQKDQRLRLLDVLQGRAALPLPPPAADLSAAGRRFAALARPRVGSRRERRTIPHDQWVRSAVVRP